MIFQELNKTNIFYNANTDIVPLFRKGVGVRLWYMYQTYSVYDFSAVK